MFSVPADKNLRIPFTFKDKSGKAAPIQGDPTLTSSDETVGKLSLSNGAILVDTQGPGTFTGTISGDADLGDGVTMVSATFDVEVTALNADHVDFGDGAVEEKPAA